MNYLTRPEDLKIKRLLEVLEDETQPAPAPQGAILEDCYEDELEARRRCR